MFVFSALFHVLRVPAGTASCHSPRLAPGGRRPRFARPVQHCLPRVAPHAVRNHPPRPCCVGVASGSQHATDTRPRLPPSCVMCVLRSPWNTRTTQSAVEQSPRPFPQSVNLRFFPFHTYAPLVRQEMLHWSVAPEVALLCYTFCVRQNEEGPADDPERQRWFSSAWVRRRTVGGLECDRSGSRPVREVLRAVTIGNRQIPGVKYMESIGGDGLDPGRASQAP